MRKDFSTRTKALAFQRANGRCEICGFKLTTAKHEFDHSIPDGLTGSNDLSNCIVACLACHKQKTRGDVGRIAKAKRQHARDIGAYKSRNPLPGGKLSKWKRKLDRTIVRRRRGNEMIDEWKGGVEILSLGQRAVLPIVLRGSAEQCTKEADEIRRFVESLWPMGIDARVLQWVRR
jgi:5-methylcytosine-specific restriction enzyme A